MTFVQNHLCQLNASFALLNKILYYLIGLLSESCWQIANYTSAGEPLAFVFLEILNVNVFNTGESPVEIGFYRQEILNI